MYGLPPPSVSLSKWGPAKLFPRSLIRLREKQQIGLSCHFLQRVGPILLNFTISQGHIVLSE